SLLVTLHAIRRVPLREEYDREIVDSDDRWDGHTEGDKVWFVIEIEPAEPCDAVKVRRVAAPNETQCDTLRERWACEFRRGNGSRGSRGRSEEPGGAAPDA